MNILKALFGGEEPSAEEKEKEEKARKFDLFKYDGIKALRMGQGDYAAKCLRAALEIEDDDEAREHLATALAHLGDLAGAEEQLATLAARHPDNIALCLRRAETAYAAADFDAMLARLDEAKALDSANAAVPLMAGRAYMAKDERVAAIASLTQAIALDADCLDAYLLRSRALLAMGDTDGARADADKLMEAVPDNEDITLQKARVEAKAGAADEAIELYNKVEALNPFCVEVFQERGKLYFDRGDKEAAKADAEKVLELQPDKAAELNGDFKVGGGEVKMTKIDPFGVF